MKFTSLGERREKCCRIKSLDGGVNFSAAPHNIADNELSSAENVEFANGVLKTRAGLSADEYDIIKNETDPMRRISGIPLQGQLHLLTAGINALPMSGHMTAIQIMFIRCFYWTQTALPQPLGR